RRSTTGRMRGSARPCGPRSTPATRPPSWRACSPRPRGRRARWTCWQRGRVAAWWPRWRPRLSRGFWWVAAARPCRAPKTPSAPPSRGGGTDARVNYQDDHLRLSDAQKDSVRAILARHRPEMEALWREVHPRFDSIRTVIRGEISGQLTPAQRAEYVRLLAEQEHQRQRQDSANANRDGGKR